MDVFEGQRVVLKSRPLTGHGEAVRLTHWGQWRVELDAGGVMYADEGELLPEEEQQTT